MDGEKGRGKSPIKGRKKTGRGGEEQRGEIDRTQTESRGRGKGSEEADGIKKGEEMRKKRRKTARMEGRRRRGILEKCKCEEYDNINLLLLRYECMNELINK